jgi:hypothetical protein
MYPLINKTKKIVFWVSFGCGSSTIKSILLEDFTSYNYSKKTISAEEANEYKNIIFVRNPYERFIYSIFKEYVDGSKSSEYKLQNIAESFSKLKDFKSVYFEKQTAHSFENLKYYKVYDIKKIDHELLSKELNRSIVFRHHDNNQTDEIIEHANRISYRQLSQLKKNKKIPNFKSFYKKEDYKKIYDFYQEDFDFCKKYGITYLVDL